MLLLTTYPPKQGNKFSLNSLEKTRRIQIKSIKRSRILYLNHNESNTFIAIALGMNLNQLQKSSQSIINTQHKQRQQTTNI